MRIITLARARGARFIGEPDQLDAADEHSLAIVATIMTAMMTRQGIVLEQGVARRATAAERRKLGPRHG